MLEIKGREELEKKIEERKIVFDKAKSNGPFEILYKHVKLNTNEMKKLGLDSNDLNLLTLSYMKEAGVKDEFILCNLTNIEVKDGKNDISDYMRKINNTINNIYTTERATAVVARVNSFMHTLKNQLARYNPQYTPEGSNFLEEQEAIFKNRKSVAVITDRESFDNIEIYDDIKIKPRFNLDQDLDKLQRIEGTFAEELKQATNSEAEIAANVNKFEEYKDYSEIKKYIEDLKETEQIAEFFKNNPDILDEVIMNDPQYKEFVDNYHAGKTNLNDKSFAKILFTSVIAETSKNSKLLKMVIMPDKNKKEVGINEER